MNDAQRSPTSANVGSGRYNVSRSDPTIRAAQWVLTAPLRLYLRCFPIKRGKGIAQAIVMRTAMREPQALDVQLPCGARLQISTGEVIGQNLAIRGEFETAELAACSRLARPGTRAIDVGANVGIFTLTLAQAVGASGRVLALEPLVDNHVRLLENIARNGFRHVDARLAAAGDVPGFVEIRSDGDPAYVSMRGSAVASTSGASRVPVRTLDELWQEAGRPLVSFVKIDVEGLEPAVVAGARGMLSACRPHLLVEAPTVELRDEVTQALASAGLRRTQPAGFEPWNYLFGP
jgi:FkbM family methyltransferase